MNRSTLLAILVQALILALILSPGEAAPPSDEWKGSTIDQSNNQTAVTGLRASIHERSANWGISAGDDNELYQDNTQKGSLNGGIATSYERNLGLMVGSGNVVRQLNDPAKANKFSIAANLQSEEVMKIEETNEAIVLGDKNRANQQNRETSKVSSLKGPDSISENNFALIFGDRNKVRQLNNAKATNNGRGPIEVVEANAAYAYGYNNLIDQTNNDDAKVVARCTGKIDQTSKNLAFAISSCCSPDFLPECEISMLNGTCPTVPVSPPLAPEMPLDEWPLDP